ncbi:MAG TPA: sigma 54-interacting transcriptional regulator [Polyangiaceae bacterium]|nr:sigma 54-interacting transcriptional regulator [Polyangiaceae bacterium]
MPEAVSLEHGLVIGRGDECRVSLRGDGISRRHAEIYRQGPIFAVKDLGSRNGTFLNGNRVQHGAISSGAVLRISDCVGVFVEWEGAPPKFAQIAEGLIGGPELQRAFQPLRQAAKSDLAIVIVGRTGTGKERVAHAVHALSGRTGPFHAINCAALPKDLAEAELFGYRKGAFTGADSAGLGHFRAAHRGTLFLDEITELPLALQAKLLRVLEERRVTPLGETKGVPVDVRIVTAAQRPIRDFVVAKEFREDLEARLLGLSVTLPALSDRIGDIAPLFQHFTNHHSGGQPPSTEAKLVERLCLHTWPGNVRELEQLARRLLAVHGAEPTLKRSFLPSEWLPTISPASHSLPLSAAPAVSRRAQDLERLALALKQTGGNVAEAASLLGFSRQRAYRLMKSREPAEFPANGPSEAEAEPHCQGDERPCDLEPAPRGKGSVPAP